MLSYFTDFFRVFLCIWLHRIPEFKFNTNFGWLQAQMSLFKAVSSVDLIFRFTYTCGKQQAARTLVVTLWPPLCKQSYRAIIVYFTELSRLIKSSASRCYNVSGIRSGRMALWLNRSSREITTQRWECVLFANQNCLLLCQVNYVLCITLDIRCSMFCKLCSFCGSFNWSVLLLRTRQLISYDNVGCILFLSIICSVCKQYSDVVQNFVIHELLLSSRCS